MTGAVTVVISRSGDDDRERRWFDSGDRLLPVSDVSDVTELFFDVLFRAVAFVCNHNVPTIVFVSSFNGNSKDKIIYRCKRV